MFTNLASNMILPYQRPTAPVVQKPFINETSGSILQPRNATLLSLPDGPNTSNKIIVQ